MTARAEALASSVTVHYDGTDYTIPAATEWDLDVLEAFEDGKILTCVRALFGADQWAAFRSSHSTVADLSDLMEAVQEALGSGN